jgi:hypothetical protein
MNKILENYGEELCKEGEGRSLLKQVGRNLSKKRSDTYF